MLPFQGKHRDAVELWWTTSGWMTLRSIVQGKNRDVVELCSPCLCLEIDESNSPSARISTLRPFSNRRGQIADFVGVAGHLLGDEAGADAGGAQRDAGEDE
jgi:hypothetical protein